MSRRPWGVRESARKSFNREIPAGFWAVGVFTSASSPWAKQANAPCRIFYDLTFAAPMANKKSPGPPRIDLITKPAFFIILKRLRHKYFLNRPCGTQ
jgi:hypothetical protein